MIQKSVSSLQWAKRPKPFKGFSQNSEVGLVSMMHSAYDAYPAGDSPSVVTGDYYINPKSRASPQFPFTTQVIKYIHYF